MARRTPYNLVTAYPMAGDAYYLKLAALAVGLTAAGFIGYKIYNGIRQKVNDRRETRQFAVEIQKSNLTLPESQYKSMADGIEMALNQRYNDDEARVYAELSKLNTADDWKKLNVVFGSRTRNNSLFSPTITGGLKDWFIDGLSSSEQAKVNEILSKIGVSL